MSKNILIFSDGTGQAGGLRPDQRLSNVYKLYRATRIGPDSTINPGQQIAFYHTGLGSAEIEAPWVRPFTAARKFLASAFGTGLTNDVADCYEAILKVYEPEDRIYLLGFSRGAYTVRSLAGVMNLCGVPIKDAQGNAIPRSGKALRKIVDEAVHTVYEHGAGHPRAEYEDEREEQARRFRRKYGTEDDPLQNNRGNVVPYFIGVFDTVAALGATGVKKAALIGVAALVLLSFAAGTSWLLSTLFNLAGWISFLITAATILIGLGIYSYWVRVKVIHDYPTKGKSRRHWSAWRFAHYDRFLDKRIRYARHAQAIDELRATFARVEWGRKIDQANAPPDWLVQMWFAGNHSDIGGSYPETESRLSDIALEWMAKEAEGVPQPLIVDWTKLNLFPDAAGMQHCEIERVRDLYPSWFPPRWRRSWNKKVRPDINLADCHPSVQERFRLSAISNCGIQQPYRPECLRNEPRLAEYYPSPTTVHPGAP
jgi:uncharacterized protein (DUF2235 family)